MWRSRNKPDLDLYQERIPSAAFLSLLLKKPPTFIKSATHIELVFAIKLILRHTKVLVFTMVYWFTIYLGTICLTLYYIFNFKDEYGHVRNFKYTTRHLQCLNMYLLIRDCTLHVYVYAQLCYSVTIEEFINIDKYQHK